MGRARDSQRSKLYDSQHVLPDRYQNTFGTIEVAQKALDQVMAARWFRSRWRIGEVQVVGGRGGANSQGGVIAMGVPSRNMPVLLHELAHEIVTWNSRRDYAAHGPEFAYVFLFLLRHVMGAEVADKLRAEFAK